MRTEGATSRVGAWVITGLALLLWCYAAIRAHTVSFSYDESYTFLEHVRKGMFCQLGKCLRVGCVHGTGYLNMKMIIKCKSHDANIQVRMNIFQGFVDCL